MDWLGYQCRVDIKPVGIYLLWKKVQDRSCYFLNVLFRSSADTKVNNCSCYSVDGIDHPALVRLIPAVDAQLVYLIRLPCLLIDRYLNLVGNTANQPLHTGFGYPEQPPYGTDATSFVMEFDYPVTFLLRNAGLAVNFLLIFAALFAFITLNSFSTPFPMTPTTTVSAF